MTTCAVIAKSCCKRGSAETLQVMRVLPRGRRRAIPKSASNTFACTKPSPCTDVASKQTRTLAVLMSLWITPCLRKCATASANWRAHARASATCTGPRPWRTNVNKSVSEAGMANTGVGLSCVGARTSKTGTTPG